MANKKCILTDLFEQQLDTLSSRHVLHHVIERLAVQKEIIINTALSMNIPRRHTPFIPVITREQIDTNDLVALIMNNDQIGQNQLDSSQIIDMFGVQVQPHYLYSIKFETRTIGVSPQDAQQMIQRSRQRDLLDVNEALAFCAHTPVLSEHYLDCTGSQYIGIEKVPIIYLFAGQPKLGWRCSDTAGGIFGSASCRRAA